MKYKKEIIIIVIILSLITILEVFTRENTKRVMREIENKLNVVKDTISFENKSNIKKMEQLEKYWDKEIKVMSLYLEHDELEKIENGMARLKANVDNNESNSAIENIEEIKFIMEHIKRKNILNIQNVF